MTEDVGKFRTEGRVDGGGECGLELGGERDVGKSDALRCKVRAGNEVRFEDGESGSQAVLEHSVDLERGVRVEGNKRRSNDIQVCCKE